MPETDEDKWWERPAPFAEMEANAKILRQTPYGLQDGNGVDVTLISSQLARTPEERTKVNDEFARHVERRHAQLRHA